MRRLIQSTGGPAAALMRGFALLSFVAAGAASPASAQVFQQQNNYQYRSAPPVRSTTPTQQPSNAEAAQARPAAPAPAAPMQSSAQATKPPSQPPAPANTNNSAQNSAWCMNDGKSVTLDQSIDGCNATIQETSKNLATAYFLRAVAYRSKNDLDRAIADFGQAIVLDPKDPEYVTNRAATYEAKKDLDRAVADYDQAIKLNPKSVNALNSRGAAYQRKGDYARATADYGEVTKLQPGDADAWAAKCWVRVVGGREVQQALADCNESLKIKSDSADVLDTRGFAYLKLGQNEPALKDYDAALKIDPKLAGSLYGRGLVKQRKGDRAGAQADIAAAKAARADIAAEFSRYGIR